MENMKASRRKQTKPNRMTFGMDTHTRAVSPPRYPRYEEDPLPDVPVGCDDAEEADIPMDMSVIYCKTCSETFPTTRHLRNHVETVHAGAVPGRDRDDRDWQFPTAYHKLGSELVQENSPAGSGRCEQQQDQALSLTQPIPKPRGGSGDFDLELAGESTREQKSEGLSVKVNGGRIFHPDAYCGLCDREFCNKYFLKTHRATKHGIYESSSPTAAGFSDGPTLPSEMNNRPNLSPPKMDTSPTSWQQQQREQLHQHQQQQPKKEVKDFPPELPGSSKKSEAELATEEQVSNVISAVKNSLQSSRPMSKPSNSGSSGSTTKDPSSEDYCQYCQKHFCNKYYLKKHKQDVHGIIPESGPTPTKRSRGSSLLDLPLSSSALGSPMLLPPPLANFGGLPPGMMMLNPFMPQMAFMPPGGMPHQPLLHPHQLLPSPMSPVTSQAPVSGLGPSTPSPHSSGLSPRTDTFCSLCRKEFSNVYFLKIHQVNKHGIQCEEVDHEARILGDMVESSGVVVPPSRSPSQDVKQDGPARPSPPPLTSVRRTAYCRSCDREFPSVQALSVHQFTEHGRSLERDVRDIHVYDSSFAKDEPSISSVFTEAAVARQGNSEGYRGSATFGNEEPPRLTERVACDICNMDVRNKRVLKIHKLQVHGIDLDNEDDRASYSADRSQRHSPNTSDASAQPLNMTVSSRPGPPPHSFPKVEPADFQDYKRDVNKMERNSFKPFTDVPSILSETINNEYGFRRPQAHTPFSGLDFGLHGHPPAPMGQMDSEQLVREGIDPEAYCNICKKELCSKYFLRTHMEKTHGIKMDIPPSNQNRGKSGPKPASLKVGSLTGHVSDVPRAGFPIPGMPFSFPPARMPGDGGGGFSRGRSGFENSHFRWKTSTSATARVTCDICNKEVCNKYFLRTHKLKKHGIAPSDSSSAEAPTTPTMSSAASSRAIQPDNFLIDKGTGMFPPSEPVPVPYSIPLPPSERPPKADDQQRVNRSEEERAYYRDKHSESRDEGPGSVACHKCERTFRNQQWLAAHLLKDHAEVSGPDVAEQRMLPPPLTHFTELGLELEPKTCAVCRILLPNEISLQLHLVHKHNALVRLQLDDTPQDEASATPLSGSSRTLGLKTARLWKSRARLRADKKLKMFVCSFGDYRTHWLYKLQAHEESSHGIVTDSQKGPSPCTSSAVGQDSTGLGDPVGQKQFKCGLCPSRFPTHAYCQVHLREKHIHMLKDFVSRKRRRETDNRLSCRFCSYTTSFPFRLHSHVSRFHSGHSLQDAREKCFADLADMVSSETPPDSVHGSPDHTGVEEPGFDLVSASSHSQPHSQQPGKELLHMTVEDKEGAATLTGGYLTGVSSQSRMQEEPV